MAESIAECLSVRREELRQQLIQSSGTISHDHLIDFDWQVKVITLCVLLEYMLYCGALWNINIETRRALNSNLRMNVCDVF